MKISLVFGAVSLLLSFSVQRSLAAPAECPVVSKQETEQKAPLGDAAETVPDDPAKKRNVAYWSAFDFPSDTNDYVTTGNYFDTVTHLLMAFLDISQIATGGDVLLSELVYSSLKTPPTETLIALKKKHGFKLMYTLGGWDLDLPLKTVDPAKLGKGLVAFIEAMPHVDGFDIDWEYPRNEVEGQQYKKILSEARSQLDAKYGKGKKLVTVAVPCGKRNLEDTIFNAKHKDLLKEVDASLDFWNLMSYDLINRAPSNPGDNTNPTNFHSSKTQSLECIADYKALGIDNKRMNIGFPMYAKVFPVAGQCEAPYLNCATDPTQSGSAAAGDAADLYNSAALRFYNGNNANNGYDPAMWATWQTGLETILADTDKADKSPYYVKEAETNTWVQTDSSTQKKWFWTWQSPYSMGKTCEGVIDEVGGIMSWSIGQDVTGEPHFKALQACHKAHSTNA